MLGASCLQHVLEYWIGSPGSNRDNLSGGSRLRGTAQIILSGGFCVLGHVRGEEAACGPGARAPEEPTQQKRAFGSLLGWEAEGGHLLIRRSETWGMWDPRTFPLSLPEGHQNTSLPHQRPRMGGSCGTPGGPDSN